jgi:hypothetical protein
MTNINDQYTVKYISLLLLFYEPLQVTITINQINFLNKFSTSYIKIKTYLKKYDRNQFTSYLYWKKNHKNFIDSISILQVSYPHQYQNYLELKYHLQSTFQDIRNLKYIIIFSTKKQLNTKGNNYGFRNIISWLYIQPIDQI